MALRLPRQPLQGFLVQAVATCLWKPYPSVTDVATYLVRPQPTPVGQSSSWHMRGHTARHAPCKEAEGLRMTGRG